PAQTLANIRGSVTVQDTAPTTSLTVDDGLDSTSRTASLSDTALIGLAAPIFYQASGLSSLSVLGGSGGDTFTVTNTPAVTSLGLGKGPNQLNVEGMTGKLVIGATFGGITGPTTAVVGSNPSGTGGTLTNINGRVFFSDLTNTRLIVDDSGDTTSRTVDMTAPASGEITGLT